MADEEDTDYYQSRKAGERGAGLLAQEDSRSAPGRRGTLPAGGRKVPL